MLGKEIGNWLTSQKGKGAKPGEGEAKNDDEL